MALNTVRNLLIVEDNPFDAKFVDLLLSKQKEVPVNVEITTRLSEGLERLQRGGIDAILLDLHLPDANGHEAFARVHDAHPNVAIIILTGTSDDDVAAEAMRQGAQDFLVKGSITGSSLMRSIRYSVERQEAHNQVRSNEERYRNIFNASHDAIYLCSMDGCLEEFNDAAVRLFGYSRPELIGVRLADLCAEREHWARLEAQLAEKPAVKDYELFFLRQDQTRIECLVTCVPRHDQRGNKRGYQGTIRDVTDARTLQRELAQAQKLESIGRLAAGIAHEINTPVQYVSDNTRFLSDAYAKLQPILQHYDTTLSPQDAPSVSKDEMEFLLAQIPAAIEESLEGLDRVATIVRAMKEFSHPGTEEPQLLDLNKALESTITVSRNEWKYLAEVVTDFDRRLPTVVGHVNQLNQVFLNIIVNAAHAIAEQGTGQKGTITITTRQVENEVEVRIADNGPGIPEAIRSKIFEPFFTTKEVGKGTGQGLAVARSVVVDKHEGSMNVESEVSIGTTFTIRLPMIPVESFTEPMAIGV